nr:SH3 domain-containing protein [Tissierella sp.]
MKKLNLAVVLIVAVSLIISFSFAGIASKSPETNKLKQVVVNPTDPNSLKNDKTLEDKAIKNIAPGIKEIEEKGYVRVNNLNVRSMGSMKGKIISSLDKGREIYVYDEEDGWYYAEYAKDKKGWVYGKYVEFRKNPMPNDPELTKIEKNGYVTPISLNVRNLGSMKGKIIGSLKEGSRVYVFGVKDGWYYVEYVKGKKGWVSDMFIVFKDIDPVVELGLKEIEKTGYVTVNNLNLRSLGSMKGKVLMDLDKQTPLYVYGEKNGWYYVEFVEHAYGWVYSKYVSFKVSDPVKDLGLKRIEKLGTATVNNLNVRSLGSMKGEIYISIDKGERLYVFGEKNDWYYVQFFEDAYGWIYGKYMTFK